MTTPQDQEIPQPQDDKDINLPRFNEAGRDEMGLGYTPSTRSAELVAGARAYLAPDNETQALSRLSGTLTARLLTKLAGNLLWLFPARGIAIEALTERYIPQDKSPLLMVDLAAGFSPRGLHMARNYSQAEVIEIDLPSVVEEKQRRLKVGRIETPSNLRWIGANLGETNLEEILDGRKVNLITSEGLTLYLTPYEQARFFSQVESNLAADGIFIGEVYFLDKLQELRRSPSTNSVMSFMLRMVGNIPGVIPDKETCHQRLIASGLVDFEEFPLPELLESIGQEKPVEGASIVVARKTAKPDAVTQTTADESVSSTDINQASTDESSSDATLTEAAAKPKSIQNEQDGSDSVPAANTNVKDAVPTDTKSDENQQ